MRWTRKQKIIVMTALLTFLSLCIALFFSGPFVYMVLMSFMPSSNDIFQWPPQFISDTYNFDNYVAAFKFIDMGKLFSNTIIMVVSTMMIGITSSVLVAYGFARFPAKGRNTLFIILLSTMMIPWVVTLIPAFVQWEYLGLIGTRWPLIIPWIGGNAFNIFMIRQFMMMIPKDLDEAAKIDGATSLEILWYVLLPQLKPVLATLSVFAFINAWSDYVGPSIYFTDPALHTLSIGMQRFFSATGTANWAHVMAASVMFSIPMVLVLFLAQKAFVRGIVATGLK
jgi:multiple sugar transport system permease protein